MGCMCIYIYIHIQEYIGVYDTQKSRYVGRCADLEAHETSPLLIHGLS